MLQHHEGGVEFKLDPLHFLVAGFDGNAGTLTSDDGEVLALIAVTFYGNVEQTPVQAQMVFSLELAETLGGLLSEAAVAMRQLTENKED